MDNSTKNGIITIAVLGLAGVVAYKLLKPAKELRQNMGDGDIPPNNGGGTTNGGTDGTGGTTNGGGGTTPPSDMSGGQISRLADTIFSAMDGYGTDEDAILGAFNQLRTNNDFNNLVSAYGTRTISSGTGNIFVSDFTGNLSECLNDELSSGWIDDINNVLRSKGISGRV